jgi:hypothetical protein
LYGLNTANKFLTVLEAEVWDRAPAWLDYSEALQMAVFLLLTVMPFQGATTVGFLVSLHLILLWGPTFRSFSKHNHVSLVLLLYTISLRVRASQYEWGKAQFSSQHMSFVLGLFNITNCSCGLSVLVYISPAVNTHSKNYCSFSTVWFQNYYLNSIVLAYWIRRLHKA